MTWSSWIGIQPHPAYGVGERALAVVGGNEQHVVVGEALVEHLHEPRQFRIDRLDLQARPPRTAAVHMAGVVGGFEVDVEEVGGARLSDGLRVERRLDQIPLVLHHGRAAAGRGARVDAGRELGVPVGRHRFERRQVVVVDLEARYRRRHPVQVWCCAAATGGGSRSDRPRPRTRPPAGPREADCDRRSPASPGATPGSRVRPPTPSWRSRRTTDPPAWGSGCRRAARRPACRTPSAAHRPCGCCGR